MDEKSKQQANGQMKMGPQEAKFLRMVKQQAAKDVINGLEAYKARQGTESLDLIALRQALAIFANTMISNNLVLNTPQMEMIDRLAIEGIAQGTAEAKKKVEDENYLGELNTRQVPHAPPDEAIDYVTTIVVLHTHPEFVDDVRPLSSDLPVSQRWAEELKKLLPLLTIVSPLPWERYGPRRVRIFRLLVIEEGEQLRVGATICGPFRRH